MHGHGDKPFLCTYDGCERGVLGNGFPRHWNLRDHMKRVHNDPGQAKSPPRPRSPGDTPPPSATRSKKRKAEDKPDAPVEKAAKRVPTPPVVQEPSLAEQYARTHELATAILQQLQDPSEAARKMKLLYESMKVMAQTSQRINNVPATESSTTQHTG